jgi:hypothetical protein
MMNDLICAAQLESTMSCDSRFDGFQLTQQGRPVVVLNLNPSTYKWSVTYPEIQPRSVRDNLSTLEAFWEAMKSIQGRNIQPVELAVQKQGTVETPRAAAESTNPDKEIPKKETTDPANRLSGASREPDQSPAHLLAAAQKIDWRDQELSEWTLPFLDTFEVRAKRVVKPSDATRNALEVRLFWNGKPCDDTPIKILLAAQDFDSMLVDVLKSEFNQAIERLKLFKQVADEIIADDNLREKKFTIGEQLTIDFKEVVPGTFNFIASNSQRKNWLLNIYGVNQSNWRTLLIGLVNEVIKDSLNRAP